MLQVSRTWVYREAREGDLPSIQCGRYRRFDAADVEHWIGQHRNIGRELVSTSPSSAHR